MNRTRQIVFKPNKHLFLAKKTKKGHKRVPLGTQLATKHPVWPPQQILEKRWNPSIQRIKISKIVKILDKSRNWRWQKVQLIKLIKVLKSIGKSKRHKRELKYLLYGQTCKFNWVRQYRLTHDRLHLKLEANKTSFIIINKKCYYNSNRMPNYLIVVTN